jgi:glycogen operon protein
VPTDWLEDLPGKTLVACHIAVIRTGGEDEPPPPGCFVPDNLVCAGDVSENRPAPLGMYRCFLDLGVWPARRVVKVDDTVPGLLEGRHAGCWTVAVTASGNEPGLSAQAWQALGEAGLLSYRVLWFERQGRLFNPPAAWPEAAVACVATHDVPTLAGWWEAEDVREREALGLFDASTAHNARTERAAERAALLDALALSGQALPPAAADGPFTPEVAAAIHAHVAATPSAMMLVQAEDLGGERVAVNLPGTDRQRPNWRLRLTQPAMELVQTPVARAILDAVRQGRGRIPG